MTDALCEYIGEFCHTYLDDIVIWSNSIEEHIEHLRKIFEAMCKVNLYCNLYKTFLFGKSIDFLGHVITANGINADPRKCEKVLQSPTPTTASNVHGFIGLMRYLAAFLPQLAEHTSVLTPLTTKDADLFFPRWTREHQHVFDAIKALVTGAKCLTIIDYNNTTGKKIFVTMDASNHRTGTVLSFGTDWQVAYNSYQLNSTEHSYPMHEKELLAIIKAPKKS